MFNFKKDKNNSQSKEGKFNEYYSLLTNEKTILNKQLLGNIMLSANLNHNDPVIKNFHEKVEEAYLNNYQIVFEDFVIDWIKNTRFSSNKLIPTLRSEENSNVESVNLKNSDDPKLNLFLESLNKLINHFILEGHLLEVIEGIIVYKSPETNTLKIVFSESTLKSDKQK